MNLDTIIALGTPPGVSALATLRLSGPDCRALTDALLAKPHAWQAQRASHLQLVRGGEALDDVVATYWAGPRSYTGEDVLEISCHGNPLIVRRLLEAYLEAGARHAEPGEFTERAFVNGRMDLTQAEAVLDVIHAATGPALAGAQAMKQGRLGQAMLDLRQQLIDLLAHLEAFIDFPEEDIDPDTGESFQRRAEAILTTVRQLRATAPLGRILREGVATAIIGAPNVGKSSLLNALLHEDRAIVSPTPGTTRDTIEAECDVRGFRLRLIDTAGERETPDAIEAEGVRRAHAAAERAQLILHVCEAHVPAAAPTYTPRDGQTLLRVASKADLGDDASHTDALRISTTDAPGLAALEEAIVTTLSRESGAAESHGWLTVNARQEAALARAESALASVQQALRQAALPELISVDLRAALNEIGHVVGLATNEDVLDSLFRSFCIGK